MEQVTPFVPVSSLLAQQNRSQPESIRQKKRKLAKAALKFVANKNRKDIELGPILKFVQAALNSLLHLVNTDINLVYFVFDGAFGNNAALLLFRQCNLHLISKMRYDSDRYLPYSGKYSGRGLCLKYGKKLTNRALAKKYLKECSTAPEIRTCIYQLNVWHKLFADMLNLVIIVFRQCENR